MKQIEVFPRRVFDDQGRYTVTGVHSFRVMSRTIQTLAEIEWASRDVRQATEMMRECASEAWHGYPTAVKQSLWWGAVILYSKPFTYRNSAREEKAAIAYLDKFLDERGKQLHEYLKRLRDWMMAHDDGLGEDKVLVLALPDHAPTSSVFVGCGTGVKRVIGLGTALGEELLPHFEGISAYFENLFGKLHRETQQSLYSTSFTDVTLLGPHEEREPEVDIAAVLKHPRTGPVRD